jgi:hypothetical protein
MPDDNLRNVRLFADASIIAMTPPAASSQHHQLLLVLLFCFSTE